MSPPFAILHTTETQATIPNAGVGDEEQYYGEPPNISQAWLDRQIVEDPGHYKCYQPYVESISEESEWDDDRSVYQAHKAPYEVTERIHMTTNDHVDVLKQFVQAGEYRFDRHNDHGKKLRASDISVVDLISSDNDQTWYPGMVKQPPTDPFKKGMELFRNKLVTPLLNQQARWFARGLLQSARANGPYHLSKARDTYVEKSPEGLLCFVIARYNRATPQDIRDILSQFMSQDDPKFDREFTKLTRQANEARNQTLRFFKISIKLIVRSFNLAAGCNIFSTVTEKQRQEVFNAVFNQYPLYTVLRFQPRAQRAVDFPQIFAYQSADRDGFRDFYHSMFLDMCEDAHSVAFKTKLEGRAATNALKRYWERFSKQDYVQQMRLGSEMDLPCVEKNVGKAQYKNVAPAAEDFDSGDEMVEDDVDEYEAEW